MAQWDWCNNFWNYEKNYEELWTGYRKIMALEMAIIMCLDHYTIKVDIINRISFNFLNFTRKCFAPLKTVNQKFGESIIIKNINYFLKSLDQLNDFIISKW